MNNKRMTVNSGEIYGVSPGMIALPGKPMTATELQFRIAEANKRFPTPNFSGALDAMLRITRRALLRDALQGSCRDRMNYCLSRAAAKPMIDLSCYGTAVYDPNKLSELAARWFDRLERLAVSWVKV